MNENNEMISYFDSVASSWSNNVDEYEIREELVEMMRLPKNSLIADLGCGKGVMFPHLLKTEPRGILAVDISSEMLKCAAKLFPDTRITFINEDVLSAALPTLDAAVFFNAYPHFMDKKALSKKLSKCIRPGGYLFIAHSACKEKINMTHKRVTIAKLSQPLRAAIEETNEFQPFFIPEKIIDNEKLYFIKMLRSETSFFP